MYQVCQCDHFGRKKSLSSEGSLRHLPINLPALTKTLSSVETMGTSTLLSFINTNSAVFSGANQGLIGEIRHSYCECCVLWHVPIDITGLFNLCMFKLICTLKNVIVVLVFMVFITISLPTTGWICLKCTIKLRDHTSIPVSQSLAVMTKDEFYSISYKCLTSV